MFYYRSPSAFLRCCSDNDIYFKHKDLDNIKVIFEEAYGLNISIDSFMHVIAIYPKLRYDLPNGFTYLQLGRDFINLYFI